MRWMKALTQSPDGLLHTVVGTMIDQWNDTGRITGIATLVFSGNYVANGDTYDFAALTEGGAQPTHVMIMGKAGYHYEYDYTNKKILVRQQRDPAAAGGADIPFTELAAAAYPAGVTGDAVRVRFISRLT